MWNEDTNSWQTTGVETLKTEERKSPDNQTTVAFTTCNVTKLAYIALFEGPPSIPNYLFYSIGFEDFSKTILILFQNYKAYMMYDCQIRTIKSNQEKKLTTSYLCLL